MLLTYQKIQSTLVGPESCIPQDGFTRIFGAVLLVVTHALQDTLNVALFGHLQLWPVLSDNTLDKVNGASLCVCFHEYR